MKAALHKALAPAALALALCILLALPGPAAAANTREFTPVQSGFQARGEALPLFAPGRVLVKLQQDAMEASIIPGTLARDAALPAARTGIDRVDAVLASVQAATVRRAYATPADQRQAEALGVERWFIVDFTARVAADQLARRLADLPEVEAATVDWRAFPAVVPSDPMHSLHWGHNNTAQLLSYDWSTFSHENGSPVGTPGFDANAHAAWDGAQGFGNSGVIIAIIDSVVEAGLYVTAGTKVTLRLPGAEPRVVKARELSGVANLLFRRDSLSGAVEAIPRPGRSVELNAALHA